MVKAYVRDGIYIPIKYVKEEHKDQVVNRFEKQVFHKEQVCEKCDYYSERVCDVCESCANYGGTLKLHRKVLINDKSYLKLPFGDVKGVQKIFGDVKFIQKLEPIPMKKPIKFKANLKVYQVPACKALENTQGGILKSAPRTGKCIVGSSLVMTDEGLQPIKNLFTENILDKQGETIIDTTLDIATVKGSREVSHIYSKIVDATIKVTSKDGYSVQGTPNHKILVCTPSFELKWKTLDTIDVGDYLTVSRKHSWLPTGNSLLSYTVSRNPNDRHEQQVLPTEMTVDLARVLGYLVANGSLNRAGRLSISSHNEEVKKDFIRCFKRVFPSSNLKSIKTTDRVGGVYVHSLQLSNFLKDACGLGITTARFKSIPSVLFSTNKVFMLSFLGAYTSCDAWIHEKGIQFSTASKTLSKELHTVLSYLGVVGALVKCKSYARNGAKVERDYWSIFLHRNESKKLLDNLDLAKDYSLSSARFVNQRDVVPYGRKFLGEVSDKCTASDNVWYWRRKNKLYRKSTTGKLIKDRHGFRNPNILRDNLTHYDIDLLEWLDKDSATRFKKVTNPNFYFSPVVKTQLLEKPVRVYDVCVPEGHHFVANGIVNHNTVMSAKSICTLGLKTIILASQRDWLENFYETFVGSETQPAMTNASKKRIGFAKKLADFEKYDICLVTYQTFLSEGGKRLLKKVKKMFSVMVVDEVQTVPAIEFSIVVATFQCLYKHGLSGTPERKDSKEWVAYKLMGPVLHETSVERLRPEVHITKTEFGGKMPSQWVFMVSKLEKDPKRLKLIAETALKDVKAGHLVLIPLSRVPVITALTKAINKLAGKNIAVSFYGGMNKEQRKAAIEDARNYKVKIVVGNSRLLSTGINIPRASALYEVTPSANQPKAEQRFSRVLTPMDDKPQPIIRYFLDQFDTRRSCIRSEFFQTLWPKFRPKIRGDIKEEFYGYMSNKKVNSDTGVRSFTGGRI